MLPEARSTGRGSTHPIRFPSPNSGRTQTARTSELDVGDLRSNGHTQAKLMFSPERWLQPIED